MEHVPATTWALVCMIALAALFYSALAGVWLIDILSRAYAPKAKGKVPVARVDVRV